MKSKNLKTKLFTGMLTTMLIAPTVLGVTPIFDGTVFEPQVAYADQMGANFNWTINKDTGNHGSEASAKTQTVQTSDGVNVTVYLYEQSIGTLTIRYGETGSVSTFSGGQVPTTVGSHNVLIGDLGEIGSTDTISVNINVDEYTAPVNKPNAPSNVVISQDGTYISANADANSRVIVIDGQGNEIGYSADASYVELSRPLKSGETVSVVAEDRNTSMRSDVVYVTFQQAVQEISMEVWYIDSSTGKPIADMSTVKGQENTVISVDAKQIDGYDLLTVTPQMVTVASGTQVVFEYKKKEVKPPVEQKATLTTLFVDEKGSEISKSVTEEVIVGTTYKAVAKQIEGYTLVDVAEKTGTMVKGGATETFTYKKNEVKPPVEQKATLTTKYVDETGKEISKATTEEVVIGKTYTANAVKVDGYTVKGTGIKDGVMTIGGKTETFVYSKDEVVNPIEEKVLIIKYVDESMKELKVSKTEIHEKGSKVILKADEIVGYTPLVSEIEVVMDDNKTATFIYKKDIVTPEKPSNASNVKFVAGTNGTVISADVPVDTTLKILFDGEIIGESNVSGNINLSKKIEIGQEVEYFTVNSKNVESEVAKLVRTDSDIEESEVDKSELEALVIEALEIDTDFYTEDSVEFFEFVLENAQLVLNDEFATQADVNKAYEDLLDGINNLWEIQQGINKSALEKLVNDTLKLDLTKYTDDSSDKVEFALIEAEEVLANEDATQNEVDIAYQVLYTAVDGLVLKDEKPTEPVKPTEPTETDDKDNDGKDNKGRGDNKTDKKDNSKKENVTKKVSDKVNEVLPSTGEKVDVLGILVGSTLLSSLLFLRFRRR